MRVTQSMLATNFLRNLSNSYGQLAKYQEQFSTGKKISRPSDDPVVAMMGMEYRTDLTQVKQYERNLSTAYKWMDTTDAALDKATQVLQKVRELVTQASNDTYDDGQRANIADEIEQLKKHMASIANTRVSGDYIFNGTETGTAPVDLTNGIQVSSNTSDVKIEVNNGVEIKVNVSPGDVFTEDLFQDLNDLQEKLNDPSSTAEDINNFISKFQGHMDQIVSARAELGARYNRVEMIENRVSEQKVIATQVLSDNEDVDLEKVIINLKTQESIHRAALAVGARIMQPTLMDFLR